MIEVQYHVWGAFYLPIEMYDLMNETGFIDPFAANARSSPFNNDWIPGDSSYIQYILQDIYNTMPSLKFHTRPLLKCSAKTIERLKELTLEGSSQMRIALESESPDNVAIIMKHGPDIIAWCLIKKRYDHAILQVFVSPEFRRRRLGSDLMIRAFRYIRNKGFRKAKASTYNKSSREFFKSLGFAKEDYHVWSRNV